MAALDDSRAGCPHCSLELMGIELISLFIRLKAALPIRQHLASSPPSSSTRWPASRGRGGPGCRTPQRPFGSNAKVVMVETNTPKRVPDRLSGVDHLASLIRTQ